MSDTTSESFVNLDNARSEEQRHVMEKIEAGNYCPFCPEHLADTHEKPIIRKGEHWVFTENRWPYKNTIHHWLLIAAYHAETLNDLRSGAFEEYGEHVKWAEREYRIAAGGLAMRFGDVSGTGATVRHLHGHLIVPKSDLPREEKVRFKIS